MSPRVAMKLHPEGECAMDPNHPVVEARGMYFHCTPRAHVAEILSHGLLYNVKLGVVYTVFR